jgi:hypothetical protein
MPRLHPVRTLRLDESPGPRMAKYVSAASGLVHVGPWRYVISDDLNHVALFSAKPRTPGTLVRVFEGVVPSRKKPRKKRKRDFESLAVLPAFRGYPHGALLALGSGSRPRRRVGAYVALDAAGAVAGKARRVDLADVYRPILREFGEANVEGAFVSGGDLVLLQRAHEGQPRNARVRVKLAAFLDALATGRTPRGGAVVAISDIALPAIDGVALGFTDGAALAGGGFAFTAVAESTGDSYADGPCAGSAIGIVDGRDRVRALWQLKPPLKVEGIAVVERGGRLDIELVTDADNPKVPARLLAASMAPGR